MSNKLKIKSMRCTMDDVADVQRILTHESVIYTAMDDNPAPADRAAELLLSDPCKIVLRPRKNTIFLFLPVNYVTYDTHVAIIDTDRGQGARSAVKASLWIFKHTRALKLMGYVPECYKGAEAMIRSVGAVEEGRLTKSFLHGGVLHDMILLSSTKDDFLKLHKEK